ncbi:hypothetical protein SAMN06298216_2831 [Spirosomataceae bacterium TFI 002]|nr:hypothetical protein SAMN06298216_2831 [Spirosomataceae bacterium TFI 002]
MRLKSFWIWGIVLVISITACTSTDVIPKQEPKEDPNPPTPGTTPPTTGTPTTSPPSNPPTATRPDFLPKYFDEKPTCLLNKVTIESNAVGKTTKTTNTFAYDTYNRFTEIKSTTEGLAGEAVTSYVYKDSEKKIEVSYKGFEANQNYNAIATLNSDYTINEVLITASGETSKTTYFYNSNGEVIAQKYDSNLKSYEVEYTYGSKGIVKSERKSYVFKNSPALEKEDMVLEWTYGDAASSAYNALALSEPNFPTGYLGKLTSTLPSQSKLNTAAKITNPIVYEYSSNSVTDYKYTNNADNKVIRIDTDTNATSSGIVVNVKTKIDLTYN